MKDRKFVGIVLGGGFGFLLLFSVFPVLYGLGISFYDYNPARTKSLFLGLENYRRLFRDPVFYLAVKNTLIFCLVAVVANIIITLFLAEIISLLPQKWMRIVFRAVLFIPCIAPMVGTATVWKYGIYGTNGGILNRLIGILGYPPRNWFLTTWPLLMLIIVYTLWADIGYNVVLFTAGLEGVPSEFMEAAKMDGAGPLRRFFMIKLPLIRRTFAFVAIMTMANYFQMFAQFRVFAPSGGMNNTAMVLTNHIYRTSFESFDMGYASAIAMALFVLVFVVALIQNRMMKADWSYE